MKIKEVVEQADDLIEQGKIAKENEQFCREMYQQALQAIGISKQQLAKAMEVDENGNYKGDVFTEQSNLMFARLMADNYKKNLDEAVEKVEENIELKKDSIHHIEKYQDVEEKNLSILEQIQKYKFGKNADQMAIMLADNMGLGEKARQRLLNSLGLTEPHRNVVAPQSRGQYQSPSDRRFRVEDEETIFLEQLNIVLQKNRKTAESSTSMISSSSTSGKIQAKQERGAGGSGAGAVGGRGDDPPSNDSPSNDPPSNDPPSNDSPSNDPPSNDTPSNDPPSNNPASNDPPSNNPPSNNPPSNNPPSNDPPSNDSPSNDSPGNDPPRKTEEADKTSQYSGDLLKVDSPDATADALADRIGGQSRVKFSNDPNAREFDVVSDKYIAQAKPDLKGYGKSWRKQTKATFDAALETGRTPYFQFEGKPSPDVKRKIQEYSERYGIDYVIDTIPLK